MFLTKEQFADLESIHKATGCRPSESIRRAIDKYLEDQREAIRAGRKLEQ